MAKGLKLTTDEFISRAVKVHNGFYDYSKTIYTSWDEDVVVTCPVHGDFKVKAGKHIGRWQGCRKVVQNLGAFDDWFEAVCARKSAEAKKGFHENHGRKLWQS